ncbi:MAG TPA: RNA methyltransferase [Caulobacteraceae bacterium]|jgi:tRNA G18 (ribose-2'-O)-methylase SpoU|nr:RNA methyltransferase [Caulobacteraceae bacterium]
MAAVLRIDDPGDPRIQAYRDIRERDLVGREGRFVAEGEVVLRAALRSGRHPLDSLLLAEKRVESLAPLLAELAPDVPVYAASQATMDAIAGFHIHRGILAFGRRAAPPDPDALLAGLGSRAVAVGLFGIANHDNMGGIFRNAAAFGVGAVVLDSACCDPLYRKAIRTSVGASLTTPFVRLDRDADMTALFARHGFATLALSPAGATPLADLARPARTAVLLGTEGPGLPVAVMAQARTVSIPMAGAFDSLNVATTSGIVLHHLVFGPEASSGGDPQGPNP